MTAAPSPRTPEQATLRWWVSLGGILLLAAALRICNLGTFSLWLDEAFTMARATLPLPDLIAAAMADPDNAPLYLIVTHVSLLMGLSDPWLRVVPIMAGLASIVAWATWTRTHLGDRISLLVAGFMALSTFHLRYSQELRSYPYLLLITGLALLAAERLRTRPTAGSALALAAAIAVGWYTHFSFAMVLVPIVGLVGFAQSRPGDGDRSRTRALLIAAIALGTLALGPWLAAVAGALPERLSRGGTVWTLGTVARRWEFLTVGATDASTLSWLGAVLAALAVLGGVVACRSRFGRTVVIPAAATILVMEILFLSVNRWSKPRYATAAWPFLVILMVLGLDALLRRTKPRGLRVATLVALAVPMLLRADAYHRIGRPHWDRMGAAIDEARRSAEPLLIESEWIATCLPFYYSDSFESLRWATEPVHEALEHSPSVLLVTSSHHADNPELRRLARRGALVAAIPDTGELVRLRGDMIRLRADRGGWPDPAAELVSSRLEAPPAGCLRRLIPGRSTAVDQPVGSLRVEFDEASRTALRYGFSGPRVDSDGATFAWVTGPEAALVTGRPSATPARLVVALRPFGRAQRQSLRVSVNGQPLAVVGLRPGPQTLSLPVPDTCWRPGQNLIVLQFSHFAPGRGSSLPRAAALDWLEVAPLAD